MRLPKNLHIDDLPGPKRGEFPALYFRDEPVWSPKKRHIALAYTITEASLMNDVGCILWGTVEAGNLTSFENPSGVYAACWRSPWCTWLSDEHFVFKLQHFDGKVKRIPLIAVHLREGFAVGPHSNTTDTWVDARIPIPLSFTPFSLNAFRDAVVRFS